MSLPSLLSQTSHTEVDLLLETNLKKNETIPESDATVDATNSLPPKLAKRSSLKKLDEIESGVRPSLTVRFDLERNEVREFEDLTPETATPKLHPLQKIYSQVENALELRAENTSSNSWKTFAMLYFNSIGVTYNEFAIGPIYLIKSLISSGYDSVLVQAKVDKDQSILDTRRTEEILGVTSLLFWLVVLVPTLKYATFLFKVFILN